MFGGNSNWRGPIWAPINALIDPRAAADVQVLRRRLQGRVPDGIGPAHDPLPGGGGADEPAGGDLPARSRRAPARLRRQQEVQRDPHWRDHVLFYEYFHGDNGAGLGASHQTGWTALIPALMQLFATHHGRRCCWQPSTLIASSTSRAPRRHVERDRSAAMRHPSSTGQHPRRSCRSAGARSAGPPRSTTCRTRSSMSRAQGVRVGLVSRRLADGGGRARQISRVEPEAARASPRASCPICATRTSCGSPFAITDYGVHPTSAATRRWRGCASGWRSAGSSCCSTSCPTTPRPITLGDDAPRVLHPGQRGRSGARAAELRAAGSSGAASDPGLRPRSVLRRLAGHLAAQLPPRRLARGADRASSGASPSAATACAATWRCCCSRRSSQRTWGDRARPRDGSPPKDKPFWPDAIARDQAPAPRVHVHRRGLLGHGVGAAAGGLRLHLRQAPLRSAACARRPTPVREHLHGRRGLPGPLAALPREPRRAARGGDVPAARCTGGGGDRVPRRAGCASSTKVSSRGAGCTSRCTSVAAPAEPVDDDLNAFYGRLLACLRRPEVHDGEWQLATCRPAWEGNGTHEQLIVSSWQAGERRLLRGGELRRHAGAGLRRRRACPDCAVESSRSSI